MLKFLLLILLFFVVYLVWSKLIARFGRGQYWAQPWCFVLLTVALCLLGMYLFFTSDGAPAGSIYVPPEYKDGKIIAGHHLPPENVSVDPQK